MSFFLLVSLIGLPIGQVRVIPSGADANLITSISGLYTGLEYTDEEASGAIRKLYTSGHFDYVAVDTSLVDSKVNVTIQVEQPPKLARIEIVGNRKLKTNALEKAIAADSGAVLTARQLFRWEHAIREQYKKKRYLLAEVDTRLIESDREGYAVARIQIQEGSGVRIQSITFKGNQNVTEGKLKRRMKNRSKWFILRSGRFDDKKFKQDIDKIEAYYHDRGWIDAKVTETELPIDSAGNLDIVIHVDEGKRFYTGRFVFEGIEALPESTLTKAVILEENEPYSLMDAQLSVARIQRAYWEEGYIYAAVDPLENLRRDTVDVTYRIREGIPAHVRRVLIEGNSTVRENVIRREVMLLPGSVFKYSQVERSQRNIYFLGLFDDVRFYPEEIEDSEGEIDLVFQVEEKMSGQFGAGITYSAESGIMGNVELKHPNVFGGAQSGHIRFEKGAKVTQASIGLTEPWLFDTPTSLGGELYYYTRRYSLSGGVAYDKQSLGGVISASRALPLDYSRGGVSFKVERVNLGEVDGYTFPTDISTEDYPKNTISTTFNLTRDARDYWINPASGSYFKEQIEFAGGPLGGDVDFIKEILDIHTNFPLAWERKVVLTQKMKFGYITSYEPGDEVPLYERFYPGGISYDGMVRGYDNFSLGTTSGSSYIGGRAMTVFNTELKVKVTPQLALLGFFDAGNAWEDLGRVNLSELKKGIGVGIRFEIPLMGVMGFDAGFGLDYPKGSRLADIFRPHFQISQTF
ncbi:outer membrane protein assembly factor BamA [candidate division WOR-3 bacterium]|nr:outer membrane protein assembly factor BamA [candidate division WOR-3 bacterium]